MKKQIFLFFLLLFNCPFAWSQKFIKTSTPSDKALLLKTPGEWLKPGLIYYTTVTKLQLQEIEKRLNTIHQWALNVYPSPMAFDAVSSYFTSDENFASQIKIQNAQVGFRNSYINGIPTILYSYQVKFCDYICAPTPNEIARGRGCEMGPNINVVINRLEGFSWEFRVDDDYVDVMRIDGRPIRMMPILIEKWKGYDAYTPQSGSGIKMVLLHREGILPYIPVTRRQYLERSIEYFQRFFANTLKAAENPEGLNLLMDKKERDEQIKKQQKFRDDILKYYQDELDATTKAGLLETPAIVSDGIGSMSVSSPVFTTQEKGGRLLVTENPAYIKKELPKYIPQIIVYSMAIEEEVPDPTRNPYYLYDQDFPILSLQAMIDK